MDDGGRHPGDLAGLVGHGDGLEPVLAGGLVDPDGAGTQRQQRVVDAAHEVVRVGRGGRHLEAVDARGVDLDRASATRQQQDGEGQECRERGTQPLRNPGSLAERGHAHSMSHRC